MKTRLIYPSVLIASLLLAATSCIDDSSNYGGIELPQISVVVPGESEMPVYNFNYGENCVLTPEIVYNGDGQLTYEWSVGTYNNDVKGPLEFVTNDKTLTYFFNQGGSYYAHLVVSDGSVGIVQDYQISINRTFEQGYLIISNTADGRGNLAFIKDLTREESEAGIPQTTMENCLQRVNQNIGDASLIGSMIIQWYAYTSAGISQITRLLVATADQGLYIDPNTFTVSSAIDYRDVTPGFKGTQFFMSGTAPIVLDPVQKAYVKLNSDYMFGYEDSSWKGYFFDEVRSFTYMANSNQTTDTYFVNYSPLSVSGNSYSGWTSTADLQDDEGNSLLVNDELITIFRAEASSSQSGSKTYPCHVISRSKVNGKLYLTSLGGFGPYSYGITYNSRKAIQADESSALPSEGASVVPSDLYHRTYFHNGNKVYVMLLSGDTYNLPPSSQAAITFPDNEEVTYMTIESSSTAEELIIATVNKSNNRGNVYIYDVKDVRTDMPNPSPKAKFTDCADRISYIMYKPRVAN